MTAPTETFDCDRADGRLLELVLGELPVAEEAAVREHAANCDSCGRSLARLEAGANLEARLPLIVPSSSLARNMREVALRLHAERPRRAVDEIVAAAPPAVATVALIASSPPQRRPFALGALGRLASLPQAAMGTLLVMMLGLGLFAAPSLRSLQPARPPEVQTIEAQASTGSLGVEPAERIGFRRDGTGRLVPVDEHAPPEQPARVAVQRMWLPRPREQVEVHEELPSVSAESGSTPSELGGSEHSSHESTEGATPMEDHSDETTGHEIDVTRGSTLVLQHSENALPSNFAEVAPDTEHDEVSTAQVAEQEVPSRPTRDPAAVALHRQARDAAAATAFPLCIERYRQLTSRYPEDAERGRALLEMAECQRQRGMITGALTTLEEAARYPRQRFSAFRMRQRIRAEARSEPAAPAPPAAEQ